MLRLKKWISSILHFNQPQGLFYCTNCGKLVGGQDVLVDQDGVYHCNDFVCRGLLAPYS